MAAPLLEVTDLSVRFDTDEGHVHAVDRLSFALGAGEVRYGERRLDRLSPPEIVRAGVSICPSRRTRLEKTLAPLACSASNRFPSQMAAAGAMTAPAGPTVMCSSEPRSRPAGGGSGRRPRAERAYSLSSRIIVSRTPGKLSMTSLFQNRTTR